MLIDIDNTQFLANETISLIMYYILVVYINLQIIISFCNKLFKYF